MNIVDSTAVLASNPVQAPRPRNSLGKDEFLQLLVTQLRHQDPMNPSNAQEFAAQLAQFTSLEQLTNIGKTLEQQNEIGLASIQAANASAALGVVGRDVLVATDQMASGETRDIRYTTTVSGQATVRIRDAAGREVRTMPLGNLVAGSHALDARALLEDLPDGVYNYTVEVIDDAGNASNAATYANARVTGVQYGAGGPMLVCGRLRVPLSAVVEVTTFNPGDTTP